MEIATSGAVGAREPCPCGSGRRYKACHGRARGSVHAHELVTRPFEGLVDECEWVALREIVPAATATLQIRGPGGAVREVTLATVLPLAWPAMVRTDGSVYLALQTATSSGDVSRDLAAAALQALDSAPGSAVSVPDVPADGPRLQDIVEPGALRVTVHDGFGYWGEDMPDPDGELAASLERASAAVVPTARLDGVQAAYWCQIGHKRHLRWVLPDAEAPLLDALARLHAARELALDDGSRYVGAFRADGLVVPVWDLPPDAEARNLEAPAAAFRARLDAALAVDGPLDSAARRARAGLLSRQVTLR